jgi:hypothetical protein
MERKMPDPNDPLGTNTLASKFPPGNPADGPGGGQNATYDRNDAPKGSVSSTSDQRTVNNVMRHAYRVLTDDEKAAMQKIKDDGLAFWNLVNSLGNSRELSVAKTKIEESVMWAVKHITA